MSKTLGNIPVFLKGLVMVFVVVAVVAVVYQQCSQGFMKPVADSSRISDLERVVQELRAAMNVDTVRQFYINKVMRIIAKYNREMRSSLRYEIAEEVYNMSVKYTNLDVDLLCATITQQSGGTWNPDVVSESGAMGLMQIMPTEGMWIARYENITWTTPEEILFDPIYNIRIGSRLLSALIEKYGLDGGLAALNGGERRAAIWVVNNKAEGILWEETSHFLPQVFKLYEEFKAMTL